MSYVQQVEPEIVIRGVLDPGSPNFERILLHVTGPMTLSGLGITLALNSGGQFFPIFDNCFWFPNVSTERDTWVIVYSKRGSQEWTEFQGVPVLNLFWQRESTMFSRSAPNVVPMMFRVDGVASGDLL